ncbi:MAG: efflux RND transporter periplasmic adaptor subunit [Chromatiales bacterium]|jgi:RND family efflux transporter MFP subunit
MNKQVYRFAALPLLAALAGQAALAQQGPPPPTVRVDQAQRQKMASVVQAPGTVVSRNDARIAAEISGRLSWVAEAGDLIESGDVIARIDDRALSLQLQEDDATIKRLEANLVYLSQQLDRLQKLARQNNAARNQLDESTAQKAMAEQDLVQARVSREQTLYSLQRAQVRAPFSGQIVERMVQAGEFISVGGTIARLVDTTNIEVRARAPMVVAPYLFADMKVTVRDQRHFTNNTIRSVIPVGDERSRMIEVRVALDPDSWVIGSAVRVELPRSEATEVVAVPRDALILRQDIIYLFKLVEGNKVEQIPVQTGVGNGSMIEVRGNISDGDQVVIRGGERLQPGQTVQIAEEVVTAG